MENQKISVIIPVYNVKPYLERCIRSVTQQTHDNLEIILIDDGSTDGSGDLCDLAAQNDSRIIVIHQENSGLSVARNTGLDAASGTWIAFLDSDDWIEPEMYEMLLDTAQNYHADVVSCMSYRCTSDETPLPSGNNSVVTFDQNAIIKGLISNDVILFEVWNKLWRRCFIGDTRFIPKQVSEDVYFDRVLFSKLDRMVHINRVMHHYLVDRPGNTNSSFKLNRLCIFDEFDQWYADYSHQNELNLAAMIATIAAQFAIHIFEEAIDKKQDELVKERLAELFKKNYKHASGYHYFDGSYAVKSKVLDFSPAVYEILWKARGKLRRKCTDITGIRTI